MSSFPLNRPQLQHDVLSGRLVDKQSLSRLRHLLPLLPLPLHHLPGHTEVWGCGPPSRSRGAQGKALGETQVEHPTTPGPQLLPNLGAAPLPHPLQGAPGLIPLSPKQLSLDTQRFLIPALNLEVQKAALDWVEGRGAESR